MRFKYYLLVTAILSCLVAAMASAEEDSTPIFEFPEEVRAAWEKGGSFARQQLSDALFDSIDSIKVPGLSSERLGLGLYIGRTVFNNFDVAQSFTVMDTIRMPITLYSYSLPIGNTHLALQFGIGGEFRMQNIRQVSRRAWGSFQKVDHRAREIEATDWFKEVDPKFQDPANPPYTEIPKQEGNPLFQLDSLNHARYSKFWNTLSYPARLPLKAEWIDRLDIGEIVTYGGSGFVEFGAAFGAFKNLPEFGPVIEGFGLNAEYKIFLRGEYRIVILREDADHVKVKVVRRDERGTRVGIGASSPNFYLFDGFVLFGKERRAIGMNLVPFNFTRTNSRGSTIEQGFRFDLRDPEARAAYELAVTGRFARADELAARMIAAEEAAAPVERIFHKEADEESRLASRGIKIMLYNQDRSSESRSSDARVTLKDGEHHIYSTVVENRFESKLFFGSRERSVTRATIDFADQVLGVILEAWIEDSGTDGVELREYSDMVEGTLHRGRIFPRLPVMRPEEVESEASQRMNVDASAARPQDYGPTAIYFRMDVDQNQVLRFIETPEQEKWRILEEAFGVSPGKWQSPTSRAAHRLMSLLGRVLNIFLIPVDLRIKDIEALMVADSIYDNWVKIRAEADPYRRTKLLGLQFADRVYGFEMMRVFSAALEAEKVPFYLAANSLGFGRINIQEGHFSNAGKTLEEYRRAANIENPEIGHDLDLVVSDFSVNVLDENRIELRFNAKAKAHVVYFKIDRAGFFPRTERELVVLNLAVAAEGENRIVLDKRGQGYSRYLAEAFSEASDYDISLALGGGDRTWGPVAKNRFYYRYKSPLKR